MNHGTNVVGSLLVPPLTLQQEANLKFLMPLLSAESLTSSCLLLRVQRASGKRVLQRQLKKGSIRGHLS